MDMRYVREFYIYLLEHLFKKVVDDNRVYVVTDGVKTPVQVQVGDESFNMVVAHDRMDLRANEIVFNPLVDIVGGSVSTAWLYNQIKAYITGSVAFILHSLAEPSFQKTILKTGAFKDIGKTHLSEKVLEELAALSTGNILQVRDGGGRKMLQLVSPLFSDKQVQRMELPSKERVKSMQRLLITVLGTNNIAQDYKLKTLATQQAFLGLMLDMLILYIENTKELLTVCCGYDFDLDRLKEFRNNLVELGTVVNRIGDTPLPGAKSTRAFSLEEPLVHVEAQQSHGLERVPAGDKFSSRAGDKGIVVEAGDPLDGLGDVLHGRQSKQVLRSIRPKEHPPERELPRRMARGADPWREDTGGHAPVRRRKSEYRLYDDYEQRAPRRGDIRDRDRGNSRSESIYDSGYQRFR